MTWTVAQIAERIDARVEGDGNLTITGLGSLGTAQTGQISHLSSASYRHQLAGTQASAVILRADDVEDCPSTSLVSDNPYLAFAKTTQLFATQDPLETGVHPTAIIGENCEIDPTACIGAFVVIGAGTHIGAHARVFPNSVVGEHCHVGEQVVLRSQVTLYRRVRIGARSEVHSGAVLGAPGFGFTPGPGGVLQEIAQLGGVQIGADVSIGACSTIDCGALDDTRVDDGVKIDNQVQIGHNCHIGAHTLLCGCVGIAGSSVIGKHCVFAGRSGVGGDHPITVCDGVMVTACTTLTQSVDQPGVYSGAVLFHEHNRWRRNALRFNALDDLFKRVRKLERD